VNYSHTDQAGGGLYLPHGNSAAGNLLSIAYFLINGVPVQDTTFPKMMGLMI